MAIKGIPLEVRRLSKVTAKYQVTIPVKVRKQMRFRDRNKIRKITIKISSDLSPLPYRTEDFTSDDPFVREILETGINIV